MSHVSQERHNGPRARIRACSRIVIVPQEAVLHLREAIVSKIIRFVRVLRKCLIFVPRVTDLIHTSAQALTDPMGVELLVVDRQAGPLVRAASGLAKKFPC